MPDLTDAEKLRVLAAWLDLEDAKAGRIGDEVQQDLRRIASIIEAIAAATRAAPSATTPAPTTERTS